jgi:hypothetical protein
MLYAPVPDQAPLWLTLTSWDNEDREYELVWIRDDNKTEVRHINLPAMGDSPPVLLSGIAAREDRSGATVQVFAVMPRLTLHCRDDRVGAWWRA